MSIMQSKLVVFAALISISQCVSMSSIKKPYERGIKAYKGERWTECIAQFEESLHVYKLYKAVIQNCRLKCNNQVFKTEVDENIGDLKMYETFFNRKKCLINCQEKDFKDLHLLGDIDEDVLVAMQARKPYEYLHICYFRMNALPKAASAAYTYLITNPDDKKMIDNLKYYADQPEVDINEVVDLQSDDYQVLYELGIKAYNQKNWADAVANMEEVLTDYFASENSCRVECEHQPEQDWSPEIYITISNNIGALLQCQQQCQDRLKMLNYTNGIEFIADILNYIQICYYHLDRFNDAAKAATTYLIMLPSDEDMIENKRIYSTLADLKSFTERSDVAYYFKRDVYEKKLLHLFL